MAATGSAGQAASTLERRSYSVREAAQILGIGRDSAYIAVRLGTLRSIRVGRKYVVPRDAIEQALADGVTLVPPA